MFTIKKCVTEIHTFNTGEEKMWSRCLINPSVLTTKIVLLQNHRNDMNDCPIKKMGGGRRRNQVFR